MSCTDAPDAIRSRPAVLKLPAASALSTVAAMSTADRTIKDLVIANRILDNLGIVDAFGDISVRHPTNPERFFLARPVSPGAVVPPDIIEFGLDGAPVRSENRELPRERFIHAAV